MPIPRLYKVGLFTTSAIIIVGILTVVFARTGYRLARFVVDGVAGARGSTNMPVGVGGGAMTVRSDDGVGSVPNTNTNCLILKSYTPGLSSDSEIELDGVTQGQGVPSTPQKGISERILAATPWTMDMYTRKRNGSLLDSPTEGLHFQWIPVCTQGSTNYHGIVVTVDTVGSTSYSTVYDYGNLAKTDLDEDGSKRLRYKSKKPDCTKTPDGTGDEDMCEHMSTIVIKDNNGSNPKYNCTSGECQLGITE